MVELLAPQHARQRLAMHAPFIVGQRLRRNPIVEFVGVRDPVLECLVEPVEGIADLESANAFVGPRGRQPQTHGLASASGHVEDIVGRSLGPGFRGVDRVAVARDDVFVERILDVGRRIGLAPQTGGVALVLGEEQLRGSVAKQPVLAKLTVCGLHDARSHLVERRLRLIRVPRPGIAEPERRHDTKPGRFRPAIVHGDADEDVFGAGLRVFHEHVEVPVVVEGAGIQQFVFELGPRSAPVRLDQVPVGILPLRVLVEILHVRVRGRAVDVEVVLLDVLAVIRLVVGEPEQALFQNRIPLVPQGQGKAELLLVVGKSPEPVLAPPVCT